MLEELKLKVEARGYLCDILDGVLDILFRNGGLTKNNQPSHSFAGKVHEKEGILYFSEIIVPYGKTWELKNAEEVIKFLQEHYPNLEIGEELQEFDD